jgi:flagellar FliL protein
MAQEDDGGEAKKSTGILATLIPFVAVTVIAAGAAAAGAWFEAGRQKASAVEAAKCGPATAQVGELGDAVTSVLELPSIVTNLAGEDAPWLRLDVSVVVPNSTPQKDQLAAELSQDFLGYVRSLQVSELSGGTSLYLLKNDLKELAKVRTSDASLDVLIRTFVIE